MPLYRILPAHDAAPPAHEAPRRRARWLGVLAIAAVLGVAMVASALSWRRESKAIERLSAVERKALFDRTLFSLQTICRQGADALPELCFQQARLILHFPECHGECELLANRLVSRAGLSR